MPLPARKAAPISGVKGAKPRLRQPKVPRQPETQTTVALNEEYLRKRNQILSIKYKREAMQLALERDRLIEKALVEQQLSYLLVSLRKSVEQIPGALRMRFGPERFGHEMVEACRAHLNQVLTELSKLPQCVEPDWLERLEEEA
jgi:hypothetical protein